MTMEKEKVQTQYELSQIFPEFDIEAIIPSDLKHPHPGVVKLQKLMRYLRMLTNEIQYEAMLNDIKIYIKDAELHVEPKGFIHIVKYLKRCLICTNKRQDKLEILILNEYDLDEPVFIEFIYDKKLDVTVSFYGKIWLELIKNNLTIKIEPKSKVHIFHL